MPKQKKRKATKKSKKKGVYDSPAGPWKLADPPKLILSEGEQRALLGLIVRAEAERGKEQQHDAEIERIADAVMRKIRAYLDFTRR
jgi:hypothetical protein